MNYRFVFVFFFFAFTFYFMCSVDQMFHELQSEGEDPGVVKVRYSQRGSLACLFMLIESTTTQQRQQQPVICIVSTHSSVLFDRLLCSFIIWLYVFMQPFFFSFCFFALSAFCIL